MARHAPGDEVDAVVIGTGAGGAPLLARLAQAGLRVVALEAGANHDPDAYPADELAASSIYWMDERLAAGGAPQAFGGNNSGRGVGGSTLHWGAFCPRPDPRDLRLRSDLGVGADWPLDYADLAPLYDGLEADLGVSGPAAYPWDPARRYPLPPVARNAPADRMAAGCAALGLRTADAPAALVSRNRGDRRACVGCGHCHQGCRNGAKTSMDVTFLPAAVAHGAEIRPGCFAHGFELDAKGAVRAVIYRDPMRQDVRQRCRAVFLCAGGIETPRLLLHAGLGNGSDQVGRNYMAHVATQVWGTFEAPMRCWEGYPSSLITEDMVRPPRAVDEAGFAAGYLIQSLGVLPVTWATGVVRGRGLWGQALADYLRQYPHVAGIGINGECLPDPGNRLTLSDEVDATGMRKPLVHFTYGANERAIERHATALMTAIWEAAGARDIWALPRTAHTIGTCRMGTDPAASVVDPWGRSHEVPGLWIADNSVFPSSLAANPALTIMALSLRTAGAFLRGGLRVHPRSN